MTTALLNPSGIVDDLRRREFPGVLTAAGLLTACGGESSEPGATGPSLHEATSGAALLSVGASVIGMVQDPELPYRPYDHEDVAPIGSFAEPDVEAIAALRPDVIVACGNDGTIYPDGALDQLAELGEAVPQARDLTFVMAGATDAELYVFVPDNGTASAAVPQAVGLRTAGVASGPSNGLHVALSIELLAEIDADVIPHDDFGKAVTELPLWSTLPAVRAGQAHQVPTSFGASYVHHGRAACSPQPGVLARCGGSDDGPVPPEQLHRRRRTPMVIPVGRHPGPERVAPVDATVGR